ncbi:ABC transporter permease [Defluviitalea phaphyphila]|uniref:ABC transporter permease n=1 Tax=Defluviitalea phaphyphila TaxID=1473580 RepID=UPI000731A167|nr:ABC transporter permease [Defluviitalea phaphyphila]
MKKISKYFTNEDYQKKIIPFLSVLLGFIMGALIMLFSGYNPLEAYSALLKGAGFYGSIKRFGDTLLNMTTLIFTGLSVAFAFRTGLFNIGAAGQMLMGGFIAVYIGIIFDLPRIIHLPFAVISAGLAGALWASIPGILKAKFKVHEVVTTIMMNWIAYWSVYYFVPNYIPGNFDTESAVIKESASLRTDWLSSLFKGSYVNLGLFLSIIAVIIIWWILEKTTFGYELKAVGFNPNSAEYAGMKVNRNIVFSMMISGTLAGLAGAVYYLGYTNNIKIGELPTQGFDGIAVALLGLNNPIGIVFSSFLFGFMNAGKLFMSASTEVPKELIEIIIAVIIFFAAANLMIKGFLSKINKVIYRKEGEKNV